MATEADKQAAGTGPGTDGLPPGMPAEMFTAPGLRALADLLPIMIAYVDRDEVVRFVNRPMAEYLEQPRDALVGRPVRAMLGDETYATRRQRIADAMAGTRQFFIAEFHHPTRGPAAVQTEYVPWIDEADGSVAGLVMVVKDVTEQRTAERALRESEERFRRIANQAPALMWVTRLDRSRDFVNDAYMDWLGTADRETARTFDWRTVIHPDDAERITAESVAGEASLRPFSLEGRFRRSDGDYRWLLSTSSPRFGPDGEHVGFIGVATDITVAKEAELELRRQVEERTRKLGESEAQFRAVFEAALEVMVLLQPDGTILAVNHRDEAWRHQNPDEAIGMKLWDAPTLQAYPQHIGLMKKAVRAAAAGKPFSGQVTMEREGAPMAFLDVAIQPVREPGGEVIYLLFEARDITELKAAQEQLRQSQKMEALGQLTGGIAHDFNNLLTVVVGGLDLIARRVEDEKLKRYAVNALTAAERGARLTAQLLAFSRVQRLETRPIKVAPLIHEMRPMLRNVLGPGIAKEFDLDEAERPVMADPTQVEVAVLNLAINARDAMPEGGVLKFITRVVAIENDAELDPGEYVALCICDTGTGMSPDVAARAFEPFFTTKDVGKGTGLGLSMVYGMARQSGGTARIETAPGEGTTIKLLFRVADGAQQPLSAETDSEGEENESATASILVIDDDPDVRGFMVEALTEEGFTVRECGDGKAGLESFADGRPDLVVLDFVMPEMSGADVARSILATAPDQRILFVSGYSETEAIKQIAPHSPLLAKPFRAAAFAKAVRSALVC
ncbi:PAS domain S-box protein [Sphingomonas sabuli]|uniref:histidine kinase n=1 Tax=Sphingomonas sabuli TaxID=2764186 RepID=A0A7G9L076_9SPHN|nr:PAS domain S-box protein [Sphingomonas sabuli]QNM82025.1 PAS domain S-box protein [Sphingomonas sabuli]